MTCGGKKKELGMLRLISADPIIVEVAPNEDNVQLPTETTEEWEAAPGGGFAPVGPDTSPGGKVKKAVLRRVPARGTAYQVGIRGLVFPTPPLTP